MKTERTGIIVIGASAGGLLAITEVWQGLAEKIRFPVVFVQHITAGGELHLAKQLGTFGSAVVAENWMPLMPGRLHIAPHDFHLMIENHTSLILTLDDKVHFCRPAIDPLFKSAARVFGPFAIGVILSGANCDGAEGAVAIERAGGKVIVQTPETAEIAAMPEAAIAACRNAHIAPLSAIPEKILEFQYG